MSFAFLKSLQEVKGSSKLPNELHCLLSWAVSKDFYLSIERHNSCASVSECFFTGFHSLNAFSLG